MPHFKRIALFSLSTLCAAGLVAQEEEPISPLIDEPETAAESKAAETPAASDVSVGTKSFDAATVAELFDEYKVENERRAEELAPHMNSDAGLEVIELSAINVQAYEFQNMDLLLDRLDPQPRRRLERLAELDPAAAADLRVSMRSEERFFAGESDFGSDMNSGGTANVDFRKVGSSVSEALKKAKQAMREKKATDDQADLPTESQ